VYPPWVVYIQGVSSLGGYIPGYVLPGWVYTRLCPPWVWYTLYTSWVYVHPTHPGYTIPPPAQPCYTADFGSETGLPR